MPFVSYHQQARRTEVKGVIYFTEQFQIHHHNFVMNDLLNYVISSVNFLKVVNKLR